MAENEDKGAVDQDKLAEEWLAQTEGDAAPAAESAPATDSAPAAESTSEQPDFDELVEEEHPAGALRDIDFLLDIPLMVTIELGRKKMLINDLLQLGQGSVIELDKLAGEPMEILINNKLVARGEVVVVNEKFGIRLTDIISPTERLKQLK